MIIMSYKVTLRNGEKTAQVVVKAVKLKENGIYILKHADPYIFPEYISNEINFVSKDLTATILPGSPVEIEKVEPTDKEPPTL